MFYLVQAEECEITFELLQKLAGVMAESPEITHADATYRIRSSQGIFRFEKETEAASVSQRFEQLGFKNFILDSLLEKPRSERLNLEKKELEEEVELAIVARLNIVKEETRTEIRPLSMRLAYPRIPIPGSSVQEIKISKRETRIALDIFAGGRHWRARTGTLAPLRVFFDRLKIDNAFLSSGVRTLLEGDSQIPSFNGEGDYEKYITWLYQLRYAQK